MPQPRLSPGFRLIYCYKCGAGFVAHQSRIVNVHGIPSVFCPGSHEVWLDRTEVEEWTDENSLDAHYHSFAEAARERGPFYAPNGRAYGHDLRGRAKRLSVIQRILSWWSRRRSLRQPQQRQTPP